MGKLIVTSLLFFNSLNTLDLASCSAKNMGGSQSYQIKVESFLNSEDGGGQS